MKLLDIINPWGALAAARREIRDYNRAFEIVERTLHEQAEDRQVDAKAHALKVKNLEAEIRRLEQVIAGGHYRNPRTGRLGRKGERFDAGAAH